VQISQLLKLTASGLVVVGSVVIVHDRFSKDKFLFPTVGFIALPMGGGAGQQSPIRVVGGSISPLAKGGWKACNISGNVTCLVSKSPVDSTTLSTDADLPKEINTEEPEAWLGANNLPWIVSLYSWNGSSANGVKICPTANTSAPPACGNSGPSTYVTVQIIGSSSYFVSDSPDTLDDTYFRYFDPNTNTTSSPNMYYEHIKNMQIANIDASGATYKYKCGNGRCNVNVGQ